LGVRANEESTETSAKRYGEKHGKREERRQDKKTRQEKSGEEKRSKRVCFKKREGSSRVQESDPKSDPNVKIDQEEESANH